MIHVAYNTNNLYAKFVGTSMLSLFENTKENVTVHILHDNTFSQENKEKFVQVAEHYNQQVNFHNVEKICATEIAKLKNKFPAAFLTRYNIAAAFRLLLPKIISPAIEKIIYLDADTIVNLDIKELWDVQLGDKPLAAVLDGAAHTVAFCRDNIVKSTDYFNSGVIVMNLKKLCQYTDVIKTGLDFVSSNPKYDCMDQDILNYCFSTQYLRLPERFNSMIKLARAEGKNILEPKIYHYVGHKIRFEMNDVYNRLFWDTFIKTPWFNVETLGKLVAFFKEHQIKQATLINKYKDLIIDLSALMSGKTRTFLTDLTNAEMLNEIFIIKENEEIFLINQNTPIRNLIDSMTASRDDKVFFLVIVQDTIYVPLRKLLIQLDFVEGRDFLNGAELLSKVQEIHLDQ